jgi:hypothetical protein
VVLGNKNFSRVLSWLISVARPCTSATQPLLTHRSPSSPSAQAPSLPSPDQPTVYSRPIVLLYRFCRLLGATYLKTSRRGSVLGVRSLTIDSAGGATAMVDRPFCFRNTPGNWLFSQVIVAPDQCLALVSSLIPLHEVSTLITSTLRK